MIFLTISVAQEKPKTVQTRPTVKDSTIVWVNRLKEIDNLEKYQRQLELEYNAVGTRILMLKQIQQDSILFKKPERATFQ